MYVYEIKLKVKIAQATIFIQAFCNTCSDFDMEKTDSCSEIFGKFQEKHQWQSSYHISSNNHPQRLSNFET